MKKPIQIRKPEDYRYIAAWHYTSGSYGHYVKCLQERALREGAPLDACYQRMNGSWFSLGDLRDEYQREQLEEWVKQHCEDPQATI